MSALMRRLGKERTVSQLTPSLRLRERHVLYRIDRDTEISGQLTSWTAGVERQRVHEDGDSGKACARRDQPPTKSALHCRGLAAPVTW